MCRLRSDESWECAPCVIPSNHINSHMAIENASQTIRDTRCTSDDRRLRRHALRASDENISNSEWTSQFRCSKVAGSRSERKMKSNSQPVSPVHGQQQNTAHKSTECLWINIIIIFGSGKLVFVCFLEHANDRKMKMEKCIAQSARRVCGQRVCRRWMDT